MIIVACGSYYTALSLISLQTPSQGTYSEVAAGIMGNRFSKVVVRPFQFLLFFSLSPVFLLVGGTAMQTMEGLTEGGGDISLKIWITVVSFILVV